MTTNHAPGHTCDRCERRAGRLVAYQASIAKRSTAAGKRRLTKLEELRRKVATLYRNAPADFNKGRTHDHRQGRRHRIESNRRRWVRRALREITRAKRPARYSS